MIKETEIAKIIDLGIRCDHTSREIARQIMSELGIKEEHCIRCSGKGKIPTTGSAMLFPDRFPNEFMKCPVCKGLPLRYALGSTAILNEVVADKGGI